MNVLASEFVESHLRALFRAWMQGSLTPEQKTQASILFYLAQLVSIQQAATE